MKKIEIGIMALFIVFIIPTALADNVIYFDPQDSSGDPEEEVEVLLYINATDDIAAGQVSIYFDHDVVNITQCEEMIGVTDWISWKYYPYGYAGHEYVQMTFSDYNINTYTGTVGIAILTLKGDLEGISLLEMPVSPTQTMLFLLNGPEAPTTTINGTFNCGGAQIFTKDLPEGWNLISLPLNPTPDNSTSTVLSGFTQNAVKQYNATSKQFEDTTTMDPGIGYFVHVTTAGTWEYEGTPESSTSTQLKSGLNMIGVPNCGMSVGDAMGSTDYRYAARWNATSQSYEVFNPNAPAAFHGFNTMEAGEGYFVSAKSDATLPITCPP